MANMGPSRLTERQRRQVALSTSATDSNRSMTPALLTRMSMRAELGHGAVDHGDALGFLGDVGPHPDDGAADRRHGCVDGLLVPVGGDDLGALLDEQPGRGEADARAGAGDDCDLVFDPHDLGSSSTTATHTPRTLTAVLIRIKPAGAGGHGRSPLVAGFPPGNDPDCRRNGRRGHAFFGRGWHNKKKKRMKP